jgi:hypothetical protein
MLAKLIKNRKQYTALFFGEFIFFLGCRGGDVKLNSNH